MFVGLIAGVALAGGLYVNGNPVDPRSLTAITLEKVDVKVDAQGNVFINAPGFVLPGAPVAPALATAPAPSGPAQVYPSGIEQAHWWLVSQDEASAGHTVEVYVNSQQVQTVKSGEPQRIVDIGSFLHVGANAVDFKAFSAQANSGTLYVYLGSGQDQLGTVKMDLPQVQFAVGANTTYMSARSYTLSVQ